MLIRALLWRNCALSICYVETFEQIISFLRTLLFEVRGHAWRGYPLAITTFIAKFICYSQCDFIIVCYCSKSAKMLGGLSCFSLNNLQIMANMSVVLYANGTTALPVATITNLGTIIGKRRNADDNILLIHFQPWVSMVSNIKQVTKWTVKVKRI